MIIDKQVDLGAQVSPQTHLGTFVGTDEYWVQVSIPIDRLAWIDVAGEDGRPGSPAALPMRK